MTDYLHRSQRIRDPSGACRPWSSPNQQKYVRQLTRSSRSAAEKGTLSMALLRSQFGHTRSLSARRDASTDNQYTVFGKVESGLDVVDKIEPWRNGKSRVERGCPVTVLKTRSNESERVQKTSRRHHKCALDHEIRMQ